MNIKPAYEKKGASLEIEKVAEVRHLKKSFGDQIVLRDLNLDLFDRENLVILGRSGTGNQCS